MIHSVSDLTNSSGYDAVIVGAGMVGASAALGLTKVGMRVLIVEAFPLQSPQPEYTPSYDARSTALSWGSREILEQLGVWKEIATHAEPISKVHVSQKGRFGTTQLLADEVGHESLGYVVPNQWLGQCLLHAVEQQDIELCSPAKVAAIQSASKGTMLTIEHENDSVEVNTSLLVIVDGKDSETARLLGIDQRSESYEQHALIANVTTELGNQGVAYERFTPEGPLALLPLTEYESALVWTHDNDQIDAALALSDEDFCQRLEAQFGERMGRFTKVGTRTSYPLSLNQAHEQVRPGIVLLGNAAHSLHPVAGQGFNLALRGVAALIEQLLSHDSLIEALNAYYSGQTFDQKRTILASDQLVKVFGQRSMLLGIARDLGLIGLNNLPLLKESFTRTAMGLVGKKTHWESAQHKELSE